MSAAPAPTLRCPECGSYFFAVPVSSDPSHCRLLHCRYCRAEVPVQNGFPKDCLISSQASREKLDALRKLCDAIQHGAIEEAETILAALLNRYPDDRNLQYAARVIAEKKERLAIRDTLIALREEVLASDYTYFYSLENSDYLARVCMDARQAGIKVKPLLRIVNEVCAAMPPLYEDEIEESQKDWYKPWLDYVIPQSAPRFLRFMKMRAVYVHLALGVTGMEQAADQLGKEVSEETSKQKTNGAEGFGVMVGGTLSLVSLAIGVLLLAWSWMLAQSGKSPDELRVGAAILLLIPLLNCKQIFRMRKARKAQNATSTHITELTEAKEKATKKVDDTYAQLEQMEAEMEAFFGQ